MLESRILFSADFLAADLDGGHEQGFTELQERDWSTTLGIPADGTTTPAVKGSNTDNPSHRNIAVPSDSESNDLSVTDPDETSLTDIPGTANPETPEPNESSMSADNHAVSPEVIATQSTAVDEVTAPEHLAIAVTPITSARTELVFVDSAVDNAGQLLNDLQTDRSDDIEWIVINLEADRDGVEEITETLYGSVDIDAIHIISHGDGHGFQLGTGRLDTNSIDHYVGDLSAWSQSLTDDADLLIYGCDLASTEIGRNLVDSIANATTSDVAASIDATGHKQLGADWDLEYTVGDVSTDIAFSDALQSSWTNTLAGIDPTQTVPGAQSVIENQVLTFSSSGLNNAITVSDTDGSTDTPLQVSLSVNDGVLTLSQTTGLSFPAGGNGSSLMTIQGTESDINAALEGMTFTPDSDFSGAVSLNITTSLDADLAGSYQFEDNANDSGAGTAQHGTLIGNSTTVIDGTRGEVLSLDGSGDYVRITGLMGEPANITLAAWINSSTVDINGAVVITLGESPALYMLFDGTLIGHYESGGANYTATATESLPGTGWRHVAVTIDTVSQDLTIYTDGAAISTVAATAAIEYDNSPDTYIGRGGTGASGFDFGGLIDDARIYNRALTAAEIQALASDQTTSSDSVAITVQEVNDTPYFTTLPSADPDTVESITGATSVTSGDFDNDGDIDLVSTTDAGQLRLHENDGTGNFLSSSLIATAQNFSAVATYDLEGDGDIDIVAMNDDPADTANSVFVLTNNYMGSGTATFSTQSFEGAVGGESDGGQDLAIGDVDGDGRADIAGIFHRSIGDSQVAVFEQNTIGGWTKTYTDAVSNAHGIELVDLDGDTDLDIVVADYQNREVTWYDNDGNPTAGYTKQLIFTDPEQIFDITAGDFDADGDIDLAYLSWGANDRVVWLENDGEPNPGFTENTIASSPGASLYHINTADTNGDGSADLIVSDRNTNNITVYENNGTGEFHGNMIDNQTSGPVWVEAADVDGDGQNDIIFASSLGNSIGVHQNQGSGNYIRGTVNEDTDLGSLSVQIADDDAGLAILEATINVDFGTISLNTSSVTILSGANSTSAIVFEGTVADINTALNSFTYTPTTDFTGLGEVQITIDDRGNTGTGGAKAATESLFIDVIENNNDVPVTADLDTDTFSYFEGDGAVVIDQGTAVVVSDIDSANFAGGNVTVSSSTSGDNSEDQLSIRNQGNSAGLIGFDGTNVNYQNVLIGSASGGSNGNNLVVTLNSSADTAAVSALLQNITYENSDTDNPTEDSRTISFTVNDGDGGTSVSNDVTISMTRVNDAPAIINLDGDGFIYNAGDGEEVLDQSIGALVTDVDSADFASGSLTVAVIGGNPAEDVLSITHQGTGSGQIGFDGSNVSYEGTVIGAASGGTGGSNLTITLNNFATDTSVAALIASVTFENTNITSPTTGARLISFAVDDGDGNISATSNVNVNVATPAEALVQDRFNSVAYNNNNGTANWSNSWTELGESNGAGSGNIIINNNALEIGAGGLFGVDITGSGAQRTADLSTALSASLSVDMWKSGSGSASLALQVSTDGSTWTTLNSFSFSTLSTSRNTYTFDISAHTSATTVVRLIASGSVGGLLSSGNFFTDNISINYIPNTPPLIGFSGSGLSFAENQGATVIDSTASILDADSTDFNGGSLTIDIASGGSVNDRLTIQHQGTAAGQVGVSAGNVTFGGVTVGTFSGGSDASSPLVVLFNSNATQLSAQAIFRATTFDNVSESPSTTNRVISAVATDGDGGTSAVVTNTISVTAINDAPVLDNTGDLVLPTITEDDINNSGQTVAQILASDFGTPVTDADSSADEGIAMTTRNNGRGMWEFSLDAGSSWQSVGTVAENNALLLRPTDLVRFAPDGQNANTTSNTFEFRAWDQTTGTAGTKVDTLTNGGSTAFSTAIESASITTTDINDAPVLDNSATVTLNTHTEDAGTPAGVVGTAITALVQTGAIVTDVDASSQTGIAITAADASHGTWWYTTNGGTNWSQLGSVSESSARVLNADSNTRIYLQSDSDFNGTITDAITFRAWDRSVGLNGSLQDATTNGGSSAFSTNTESAEQTISYVNDAPLLTGPSIVTNGNFATGDLSGWTATGNIDNDGAQVRFGQTGGANGTLSQTVTTEIGRTYLFSFDYSDGSTTKSQSLDISITGGSNLLNASIESGITENSPQTYQYTFVADATSATIAFTDTSADHSGVRAYLDNIIVSADATPNPPLNYAENSTVVVDSTITIADIDDTDIEDALIQITGNYNDAEDILEITSQNGITATWNSTTGALSLNGPATLAQYQLALQSITYSNNSDNPDTATRTVGFTVNDGNANSNQQTRDINVSRINDAPVASLIESGSLNYTENDAATVVTSAITFTDIDDTLIEGATVAITNNFASGQDQLSFSSLAGISGNYNAGTGVLTFTGASSISNYETVLRSVTYENTSDNPAAPARTISLMVNDGDANSNVQSRLVNIAPVNDSPVQSGVEPTPLTVTENDLPAIITSTLTLTDADDTAIESASVHISENFDADEDKLAFTSQSGITGSYNATTGVMSLTGPAMIADYQTALRSVTYENISDDPSTLTRTVSIVVNDGNTDSNALTRDIAISTVNDAPAQTSIETVSLPYTENDPATLITSTLAITDPDDTLIESATVAIDTNFTVGEDVLAFTTQPGITGVYNSSNGILSFTGPSSPTNYQAALRSVTYENISDNPSALTRAVSFTLNDGELDSNTVTRDVTLSTSNDAPIVSSIETSSLSYTENNSPVSISQTLTLSDVDDTNLESATVSISGNFSSGQDTLAFVNQSGITGSYDPATGILSLNGAATLSSYQTALRSVTYENTSDDPTTLNRTFSFTVNDGEIDSNVVSRELILTAVNDAAVITGVETATLTISENDPPAPISSTITLSDSDDSLLESATIAISSNFASGEDVLLFADQAGITGNYNSATGVLTLSGSSTVGSYQSALQSVQYQNTSDDPSTLSRDITFTVNDGNIDSNQQTRTISLSAINDAPQISLIESDARPYTENDAPTIITSTIQLTDVDDTQLQSALVTISSGYTAAQDFLEFTDQSGISGTFDSPTGTLMLTGTSSVANYQAALRSITYHNTSDDPAGTSRTITFSVSDANATSNATSRDIAFTAVNDAPVTSLIETTAVTVTENDIARPVTQTLTLTDLDNTHLSSALVVISGNYQDGEDLLNFSGSPVISGSFDAQTGSLTLTGNASVAEYQTALRAVTYTNLSDNPDTTMRTVSISVSDALLESDISSRNVEITAVNDAPQQSAIEPTPLRVTENDPAATITDTLILSDADDISIDSASVQITNNFTAAEDALALIDQAGISSVYDYNTGILHISGSASTADYQLALRSVTYSNSSDNPNPQTRQVTFTVNDGDVDSNSVSRDIELVRVNDPPIVSALESSALLYSENAGSVVISTSLALSELDDINLESATVQISANYQVTEDSLNYVDTANITANWDSLTGTLTLSGSDSISAYTAALRSVTYENTSDDPNTSARTISYSVSDGDSDSNTAYRNIEIIASNDAPVQSNIESADIVYIENSGLTPISNTLLLSDQDDQLISSASIAISSGYFSNQDILSFSDTATISSNWNPVTGELTLTGSDTIAAYQNALRSVSYENTSDNPTITPRTASVSINDGSDDSNVLTRNISLVPLNDAPVTSSIETSTLDYLENAGGIAITSGVTVSDVDDDLLDSATITISDGFQPLEDMLQFADTANITGSWDSANGTLTLSGADTKAAYQEALRAVRYENISDIPLTEIRTVEFSVFDGALYSNTLARSVTIGSINDAPTGTDATLTFLEDTSYTLTASDFGFSDVLDNNNFDAITISQLPVNGTLTLDDVNVDPGQVIPVSAVNANQLVFTPQPDSNGTGYDNFRFQVQDDGGNANGGINTDPQQKTITFNITNVSDAPSGGDNSVSTPEDTDYVFNRDDFLFTDPLDNDSFSGLIISTLPDSGILKNNGIALNTGDTVSISDIDNGLLVYTPPMNDNGTGYSGFGFLVQDSGGAANDGEFTDSTENFLSFDIPGVNDAPQLVTEQLTVAEGSENTLTTAVITATDADDLLATELTFSLNTLPLHGTLSLNGNALSAQDSFTLAQIADNQLIYTHDGSETHSDFFDVSVMDGGEDGALPSSGRFSLLITEVIDSAPILENDELNLIFGQSFDSLNGNLLASGFSDLSKGQLASNTAFLVEIENPPTRGTVEVNADGTFTYEHDGSVFLADFFTYRVTNEDGIYTIARVDIKIEPPLASAFGEASTPTTAINIPTGQTKEVEEESTEPETISEEERRYALLPQQALARQDNTNEISNALFSEAVPRIALNSIIDDLKVKQHNKVRNSTVDNNQLTFSKAGFEVLLEVKALRPHDVVSNQYFLDGLARLEDDLQQSEDQNGKRYRLANDATMAISLSATAGVISWVLRGSALFASAMASTPLWSSIDPVKVLSGHKEKEEASAIDNEVEQYFSDQG